MLRKIIYPKIEGSIKYVARKALSIGLKPDHLTYGGLALSIMAAVSCAYGLLALGGLLILVAGICDILDGALARAEQKTSKFGAFIDSTIDRYSDLIILGGILIHFSIKGDVGLQILTLVVIAGSMLTSYTKARAEGLGVSCNVGIIERPERIGVLVGGLLLGFLTLALWALAILSQVTVLQRIFHTRKQLAASK